MGSENYGRTLFDWISEHPKKSFTMVVIIFIGLIGLILLGRPMKIGEVEFNNGKHTIIHDTTIAVKKDTVYVSTRAVNKRSFKQLKPTDKQITIKKGDDTIIAVKNQPANVNMGVNNGIIGNDNKINVGVTARDLDSRSQAQLLGLIVNKDEKIIITSVMGDQEAFSFAKNILLFLKSQKYTHVDGVNQGVYSEPIIGQILRRTKENDIEIIIGSNKPLEH